MKITHLRVVNWRNFSEVDIPIGERLFLVGPNASGKSNLLDVFRFLGEIASPGGGLAAAMAARGNLKKVRNLYSRNRQRGHVRIEVSLLEGKTSWKYILAIKGEERGLHRNLVATEQVWRNDECLVSRPDAADEEDSELLTQTHLEQIAQNRKFREVATHLEKVRYFHPVPQIIRNPNRYGHSIEADPFGSDVIARMNAETPQNRNAWLRRIEAALQVAVPQFESLEVEIDSAGTPHLSAKYQNWRPNPAAQTEADFSDGTLRLIGLLWSVVSTPSSGGLLLLEEPELSLNAAIVRRIPSVLASTLRSKDAQYLLATHAPELMDEESILPREVLVLTMADEGTSARLLSDVPAAVNEHQAGVPISDIVQPMVEPPNIRQLAWNFSG